MLDKILTWLYYKYVISSHHCRVLTVSYRKEGTMDLSARKIQILQAIIDDYIMSGVPVGSRTISKKYNMGLSSATIRNEMSDLEELGFLDQPHISSGRVPSAKAYRLYVDSLIKNGKIQNNNSIEIKKYFSSHIRRIEDVVQRATYALSELTNYTALALLPSKSFETIRNIQIVPISSESALIVVVMYGEKIYNRVIKISSNIDKNTLDNISTVLTERLGGKSLYEISDILGDLINTLNINSDLLNHINESIDTFFDDSQGNLLKTVGAGNLLNYPELLSVDKAKNLLTLLDDQNEIIHLLQDNNEMEFTVRIGPETGIDDLCDCSIITANYTMPNRSKGTIGIIGPTRMPYKRILEILNTVGKELTNLLDE